MCSVYAYSLIIKSPHRSASITAPLSPALVATPLAAAQAAPKTAPLSKLISFTPTPSARLFFHWYLLDIVTSTRCGATVSCCSHLDGNKSLPGGRHATAVAAATAGRLATVSGG
jgi:hypothetical protein